MSRPPAQVGPACGGSQGGGSQGGAAEGGAGAVSVDGALSEETLAGRNMMTNRVTERLAYVRDRIAGVGAAPGSIRIVAVTKGFGPAAVDAAVGAGIHDIGESYAQELLSKLHATTGDVRWHFLGALQRNKLSRLAPHVHLWHGLSSEAEALALSSRSPAAAVLVEVRVAGPAPRRGASPDQVPGLVGYATGVGLQVKGLMAVGPRLGARSQVRKCFWEVARLAQSLGLVELSMGMSNDFELAVAEGATIVRLGRALFGDRLADAPGWGAARLR